MEEQALAARGGPGGPAQALCARCGAAGRRACRVGFGSRPARNGPQSAARCARKLERALQPLPAQSRRAAHPFHNICSCARRPVRRPWGGSWRHSEGALLELRPERPKGAAGVVGAPSRALNIARLSPNPHDAHPLLRKVNRRDRPNRSRWAGWVAPAARSWRRDLATCADTAGLVQVVCHPDARLCFAERREAAQRVRGARHRHGGASGRRAP